MLGATDAPLMLENIPALQDEVRALARERDAVILAHNYQLPEIQDVADYVGDSLGLSQQAAAADARHDRLLRRALHGRDGLDPLPRQARADPRPRRRLLAGRLDHRRAAARVEGQAPRRGRRHVRQHDRRGQGRDRLLLHLGQRRRGRRAHLPRARRRRPRSCSAPTCSSAPTSRRRSGRPMHVWDGECHVHAGIKPDDISAVRAAHPGADFLIHPECGCSTSVMEYVAAGDVDADGVHMLSTGGMLAYAREHRRRDRDRRHRDRDAAPAAPGRPGRRVHRRQRGRALPVHEDDHAAEAARRRCATACTRSRCRPRSPIGPGSRSSGWSRSADRRVAVGQAEVEQVEPLLGRLAHRAQRHRACARTRRACSSGRRPGRPSRGVPQRTGLVDALEPGHALVGRARPARPRTRARARAAAARRARRRPGRRRGTRPRSASDRRRGPGSAAARAGSGPCPAPRADCRLGRVRIAQALISTGDRGDHLAHRARARSSSPDRRSSARTPACDARALAVAGQVRDVVERAGLGDAVALAGGVDPIRCTVPLTPTTGSDAASSSPVRRVPRADRSRSTTCAGEERSDARQARAVDDLRVQAVGGRDRAARSPARRRRSCPRCRTASPAAWRTARRTGRRRGRPSAAASPTAAAS